jgi:hypothetical protein
MCHQLQIKQIYGDDNGCFTSLHKETFHNTDVQDDKIPHTDTLLESTAQPEPWIDEKYIIAVLGQTRQTN